jgi:hypothetical protein
MRKFTAFTEAFYERFVLRYPKTAIIFLGVVVVFLAWQALNFSLDASAETLVLENDVDLQYSRKISECYGQQDFLIVTYTPEGEMFSAANFERLVALRDELKNMDAVSRVISILDVPLLQSPPIPLAKLTEELPTLEKGGVDFGLAMHEFSTSPLYNQLLISDDLKTTAILLYLRNEGTYEPMLARKAELTGKKKACSMTTAEMGELRKLESSMTFERVHSRERRHRLITDVRKIMDGYRDNAELFLGGVSMIADDMITYIKNDLKVFGVGVLVFMTLTLAIIFRAGRWVVLPLLCCGISVLCMLGFLGLFDWQVTVISSNFISLQLILTMSIALHLVVRYRELCREHPTADNTFLLSRTIRHKFTPCLYATLTTIAGFASLVVCDILPVRNFGWMMIAGLVVSLFVTFWLFVCILAIMRRTSGEAVEYRRFSVANVFARWTDKRGVIILIASLLIFVVSIFGIFRLRAENSFIDYFHHDTEIYQGMKLIDDKLGGTTPLDVVIEFESGEALNEVEELAESDDVFEAFAEFEDEEDGEKYWFTADKMDRVQQVHNYLESRLEVGKVLSLGTILQVAEKLNDGKKLDSFSLALLYNETPEQFQQTLLLPYVCIERNEVRFWARIKDSMPGLRRDELLKSLKSDMVEKLGFDEQRVHLTGLMVLYNNMLQSLFDSQILTLGITLSILGFMFLVLLRSIRLTFIAMVPNIISICFILGLMGLCDIPLDMMTITIAAVSIGIAVDDTIHYIHRFSEEIVKDGDYIAAMYRSHNSIGHAMIYTSVTIIAGFSVLAFSNFVPTVSFGLLIGLAMLAALLGNMLLLGVIIVRIRPFGDGKKPGVEKTAEIVFEENK